MNESFMPGASNHTMPSACCLTLHKTLTCRVSTGRAVTSPCKVVIWFRNIWHVLCSSKGSSHLDSTWQWLLNYQTARGRMASLRQEGGWGVEHSRRQDTVTSWCTAVFSICSELLADPGFVACSPGTPTFGGDAGSNARTSFSEGSQSGPSNDPFGQVHPPPPPPPPLS